MTRVYIATFFASCPRRPKSRDVHHVQYYFLRDDQDVQIRAMSAQLRKRGLSTVYRTISCAMSGPLKLAGCPNCRESAGCRSGFVPVWLTHILHLT